MAGAGISASCQRTDEQEHPGHLLSLICSLDRNRNHRSMGPKREATHCVQETSENGIHSSWLVM